jgi:hypothetical protein
LPGRAVSDGGPARVGVLGSGLAASARNRRLERGGWGRAVAGGPRAPPNRLSHRRSCRGPALRPVTVAAACRAAFGAMAVSSEARAGPRADTFNGCSPLAATCTAARWALMVICSGWTRADHSRLGPPSQPESAWPGSHGSCQ